MSKRIEDIVQQGISDLTNRAKNTDIQPNGLLWDELSRYSAMSTNPEKYSVPAQNLADYIKTGYNLSDHEFKRNLEIYETTAEQVRYILEGRDE